MYLTITAFVGFIVGFASALGLCLRLTAAVREENETLRRNTQEMIDKFVHNKQPQRFVPTVPESIDPRNLVIPDPNDMGDPVSVIERLAWEESRPKEQTA